MNGRRAKEIRQEIYGSGSKRNEGIYEVSEKGTVRSKGKRAEYQKLKKEFKDAKS
jgi:hypothetical protein